VSYLSQAIAMQAAALRSAQTGNAAQAKAQLQHLLALLAPQILPLRRSYPTLSTAAFDAACSAVIERAVAAIHPAQSRCALLINWYLRCELPKMLGKPQAPRASHQPLHALEADLTARWQEDRAAVAAAEALARALLQRNICGRIAPANIAFKAARTPIIAMLKPGMPDPEWREMANSQVSRPSPRLHTPTRH
jgi:hypothetical protein